MNVTLGVPRLKEIINAARLISTPIITGKLEQAVSKVAARIVKGVIEKTTLGEVAKLMKEVYSRKHCYISVELDMNAIEQLKLNVDAYTVRNAIIQGARRATRNVVLRSLGEDHVSIKKGSKSKFRVQVPYFEKSNPYFTMQALKAALPEVIVQGIPTIQRAVINESNQGDKPTYNLLMEGYGLQEVIASPGIDGLRTTTNHVLEIEQVLGVEAARTQISAEIEHIMNAYGMLEQRRHAHSTKPISLFS
jgi:DNA-directed RNA polymerase III subunit RPC1